MCSDMNRGHDSYSEPGHNHQGIFRDELKVRYLSFNDTGSDERKSWLEKVFNCFEEHSYSENSTNFISTVSSQYDAIVIGGNDVRRMIKVLKSFAPILKNKLKVCILTSATPAKRARAVAAGFDDAIDIERTSPAEAVWRSRAMWRRYAQSMEQHFRDRRRDDQLVEVADASRLPWRHKQILSGLMRKRNRYVSYHEINGMMGNGVDELSVKHIQVLICQIRKYLNRDYRIICEKQYGYRLVSGDRNTF